ncbi:major histocompatibility complex class I-related gene protein-like, partial [Clupea harengus]|uniref:Major histocompatibility complex class I-related gene protein-like n=1 Tax=Clupea harengus TaxID=7950 RepID=A0A8M1KCB2_CLUHA
FLAVDLKVESLEEQHSLHYVYTALSKPVSAPGIFEFTAIGILDDRKIDYYNSRDKVKIPQQAWMEEKLPAEYWNQGTLSRKSKEQWLKVNVNILMERMRHNNSDIHVLMWRVGCDVISMPDGSLKFVNGLYEFSYDGMDFLSFDVDSTLWLAPVTAAVATKQKWDTDPKQNSYIKHYVEKECVRWLNDLRRYRDENEKQTGYPPKINLFAKDAQSSDTYKLTCMATGLYSRNTEISILKSGWSVVKGYPYEFVPNDDGTYQIRLSVDAKKSEINDYGCEVNHGDQKTRLVAKWPKGEITLHGYAFQFTTGTLQIRVYLYHKENRIYGIFSTPSAIGLCVPYVLVVLGLVLLLVVLVIVGVICVKKGIIEFKFNRPGSGFMAPMCFTSQDFTYCVGLNFVSGGPFRRQRNDINIPGNGNATSADGSAGKNERGSLPGSTQTSVEIKPLLEGGPVAVKKNADSDSGNMTF